MNRARPRTGLAAATAGVLLIALAFSSAAAATSRFGLVARSSKAAGFVVSVPSSWKYRNASYPSDHTTELWTDPQNAKRKLEVQVSGCVGCVERTSCVLRNVGCGPYPAQVLPAATIQKRMIGRWSVRFIARDSNSPYLIYGLVTIRHKGSSIEDWAYAEVWVPATDAPVAGAILSSFRFTS